MDPSRFQGFEGTAFPGLSCPRPRDPIVLGIAARAHLFVNARDFIADEIETTIDAVPFRFEPWGRAV